MNSGQTLAHYTIIRQLGRGGMGEVYLANDTTLDRQVAIKVLPDALRQDPERLARFRREAKAAASLKHHNIATIYSLEEADDVLFIVMEYVEGDTLSDHIPASGMDLDMFFATFIPLSDALAHAHELGRVHRDIKPGNIMLTPNGTPKILDFGLARIIQQEPSPQDIAAELPTQTMKANDPLSDPSAMTDGPKLMGTPMYMSPEQVEMEETDHRTDLFSFGVVMYEVLTGKKAFEGKSRVSLLGRIVSEDPVPVTSLTPTTPHQLWWTIRRCLEKDRGERTQTADELHAELCHVNQDVQSGTVLVDASTLTSTEHIPETSRAVSIAFWRQPTAIGIAAIALIAGILGTYLLTPEPPLPERPLRKFQWPVDGVVQPALSPDGTRLAYRKRNRLWIRDLNQATPRELPDSEGASLPFWSPDSDFLGYQMGRRSSGISLWKVSAEGGQSIPICTMPAGVHVGKATWGTEGRIVFAASASRMRLSDADLHTVSENGGEPEIFLQADATERSINHPYFLPDGSLLLVVSQGGDSVAVAQMATRYPDPVDASAVGSMMATGVIGQDIAVYSPDTGRRILDLPGDFNVEPVYADSGHLLFRQGMPSRTTTLWAVRFDQETSRIMGAPFVVAPASTGATVSADGALVYHSSPYRSESSGQQLLWIDRSGRITDVIGSSPPGTLYFWSPAVSPDGTQVAVSVRGSSFNNDLWVFDRARGSRTQLVADRQRIFVQPVWSPSGTEIAFSGSGEIGGQTGNDMYRIPLTGQREPSPLLERPGAQFSLTWSRHQNIGVYHQVTNGQRDLWSFNIPGIDANVSSAPEPVRFMRTPDNEARPHLSPDGQYVAYQSQPAGPDRSAGWEVYVQRFPSGGEHTLVSVNGGVHPRWSARGDELFFVQPDGNILMGASIRTQPELHVGEPQVVFFGDRVGARLFKPEQPRGTPYETMYDVSPDGQHFVVVQHQEEDGMSASNLTLVENWVTEFAPSK
jgi:eukaryotic-like serine/threonine-protein kinase